MADCKKLTSLIFFESLILAQDECWRRALGMQVERDVPYGTSSGRRVSISKERTLKCGITCRKAG